ncbi:Mss4-like protein [Hyaloraphidium curvatum]|nr:Mss4-like protein [Hyaloraphidium curvatum]
MDDCAEVPFPVTSVAEEQMSGRCFCGAVSYTVAAGSELRCGFCCCRTCQRLHAAPIVAWFGLKNSCVEVAAAGQSLSLPDVMNGAATAVRTFASSSRARRACCSNCGTPIFFQVNGADWIDVTHASLDEPWIRKLVPAEHLWQSAKLPWFETTDSWAPRYTEEPLPDELGTEATAN